MAMQKIFRSIYLQLMIYFNNLTERNIVELQYH